MQKEIDELKTIIKESNNIVFFGGAGVSTESGIPDFRSKDGLYNQKYEYPPEVILSHSFFIRYPEVFYKFYREKLNSLIYKPNITHEVLARLENEGKIKAVVTQNIDGLHQKAGSKTVYELHGSVHRNYCMECHKFFGPEKIFETKAPIPLCDECGGIIKPDVVLYEEGLNPKTLEDSINAIRNADVLIVGGSSLTVYPAAGLVKYYQGSKMILINRDVTDYDGYANLVIHDSLGKVFGEL